MHAQVDRRSRPAQLEIAEYSVAGTMAMVEEDRYREAMVEEDRYKETLG